MRNLASRKASPVLSSLQKASLILTTQPVLFTLDRMVLYLINTLRKGYP